MTDATSQSTDRPVAGLGTSEAFVAAFRTGWSLGSGADEFCDHFVPTWVDPDVTLVQPLAPPAHGFEGFRRFAQQVFALAPDLRFDYVTRVFGIRAIALGLGYLSTTSDARRRWQRLAFLCDISDTIAGVGDLMRGNAPRSTALRATLLTGTYAAIGAARIAHDPR